MFYLNSLKRYTQATLWVTVFSNHCLPLHADSNRDDDWYIWLDLKLNCQFSHLFSGNNKSTPGPKFDPFDVDPNDPFDVDKHRHVFYSDVSIIL